MQTTKLQGLLGDGIMYLEETDTVYLSVPFINSYIERCTTHCKSADISFLSDTSVNITKAALDSFRDLLISELNIIKDELHESAHKQIAIENN
jgi:hypothetical protein